LNRVILHGSFNDCPELGQQGADRRVVRENQERQLADARAEHFPQRLLDRGPGRCPAPEIRPKDTVRRAQPRRQPLEGNQPAELVISEYAPGLRLALQ
jgi:hypothetical protein